MCISVGTALLIGAGATVASSAMASAEARKAARVQREEIARAAEESRKQSQLAADQSAAEIRTQQERALVTEQLQLAEDEAPVTAPEIDLDTENRSAPRRRKAYASTALRI